MSDALACASCQARTSRQSHWRSVIWLGLLADPTATKPMIRATKLYRAKTTSGTAEVGVRSGAAGHVLRYTGPHTDVLQLPLLRLLDLGRDEIIPGGAGALGGVQAHSAECHRGRWGGGRAGRAWAGRSSARKERGAGRVKIRYWLAAHFPPRPHCSRQVGAGGTLTPSSSAGAQAAGCILTAGKRVGWATTAQGIS